MWPWNTYSNVFSIKEMLDEMGEPDFNQFTLKKGMRATPFLFSLITSHNYHFSQGIDETVPKIYLM